MILNQFKIMWLRPQGAKASTLLCYLSASQITHFVLIYVQEDSLLFFFFLINLDFCV